MEKIFNIPASLVNHLKQNEIIILDVRTPMEFIHGHIVGATNVPFDEIERFKIDALCCDKPVVTCSGDDERSQLAYQYFKREGFNVVDGGDWQQLQSIMAGV